jgi:hypothetical protein
VNHNCLARYFLIILDSIRKQQISSKPFFIKSFVLCHCGSTIFHQDERMDNIFGIWWVIKCHNFDLWKTRFWLPFWVQKTVQQHSMLSSNTEYCSQTFYHFGLYVRGLMYWNLWDTFYFKQLPGCFKGLPKLQCPKIIFSNFHQLFIVFIV